MLATLPELTMYLAAVEKPPAGGVQAGTKVHGERNRCACEDKNVVWVASECVRLKNMQANQSNVLGTNRVAFPHFFFLHVNGSM